MKFRKIIGRRLKGSVVIEAAIISPIIIILMLLCIEIVTLEFMDSVRTLDFVVEESKYNGIGPDVRQMSGLVFGVSGDETEVVMYSQPDFGNDKLSGSISAADTGANIKDVLFEDDLEIDVGSYKVVNWLIARERIRNIYK